MNVLTLIVSAGFILSPLFVCSQTLPHKGYYSIYNNKEKLISQENAVSDVKKTGTHEIIYKPKTQKGFYSIKNNEKLTGFDSTDLKPNADTAPKRRPGKFSKGYYSIGTNHKKLNNR